MLVGIMPISAIAADAEPPAAQTGVSTKTSENTTGPKLEKSAQWVDEKAGIAMITIKVTGEQPTETTKKTDIVLVIDRSLSMTRDDDRNRRDWLDNAKKAAKAFANKVLTGDPNVRIAVVAYAAKTIDDRDFSSDLTTVQQHIDAINTDNGNWHGTNIQAGIHSARERFKKTGNKDADKFMIVLADGAPNYRFTYKDWGIGTKFDLTDAQKRTYHINNWFSWLFYATSDAFNYNEVKNTEQYAYTAAASEAYAAKATDGITCYAIGYGIPQGNNEINALMYSIASTDAGFVNAGTDENAITKVFSDIATDIQYKAHDVTLTDTMGAGFTYLSNETYPSNPVVTPSAGNKTVTWNVADKLGDETKTLTFYVQYDKQNLTEAETLPTNTSASLSYEDNKGNAQTPITVDSPAIENLAFTVTYLDETGTERTAPPYTKTRYWHGDTVAIKDGPAKDGYDFTGWTVTGVTPAEGAKSFDMPKNNVTLKANYTPTAAPALTITKTAYRVNSVGSRGAKLNDTDTVKSGDKIEYDLTVKNTGDVTLSMIEVRDDFQGKGTLYVDGEAKEADWKYLIGALHPDDYISYSGAGKITYTVTEADVTAGTIVNKATATVIYEGQEIKAEATHTLNAAEPTMDIKITKIWDKTVSTDRDRSAKIQLYANGEAKNHFYTRQGAGITEKTSTMTFTKLPVKDASGNDIRYTVKEIEINEKAVTSDNQLVTEDEIWTGAVTGNAVDGFTVTNSVRKNERYGVEVTKTATRTRTLADGSTDTVALATTGDKVRVGDVIRYTVTIKNTGNVAFPAGSRAGDTFAAATGSLIDDATQKEIPSGSQTASIEIALTEPNVTVTKTYTYFVLEADNRITNTANASIPNGTMNPERDSDAVVVTVEKPHGVTYTFENNDGLPTEVQTLLPTQDTNKYYKDDSVNLPTLTDTTKQVGSTTYTFVGWHVDGVKVTGSTYTMDDKDVTFVGKWKSVTVNPKYKLSYVFKSGDDTITTLPENVLSQNNPAYSDEVEAGTDVTLPSGFTEVTDTVNKGKWTFVGWYTDDNLSAESKITGDTYPMPEGGKTLYGKWTFEADKPEITEAGYTVEYYRQNADGEYLDYPYHRKPQPGDPALTGTVGSTAKVTDVDSGYITHYDADGYEFDANNENNVLECTLQADASKNVLRLYYKALPELEVKKEVDKQYNVKHGDTLTYTITVKNAGARNLTNVEVTDVIDAADPSKLEILPGEGYTYNEASGKIEIGRMEHDNEVVIKATYVVQEADSGHTIKNTATGSADGVEGVKATVNAYPNKIEEFKGDLVISKTYRSDTSTSPAATFYFDVYYMDGDEQISLLDEYAEISFDKNEAKKGAPATKTVEVKLNDVNEKVLESGFYVREVLEDKVDKVVYDRNAVHGFLVPFPLISAYADTDREPITVDREAYVVSTQVYENAGAFWAAWVTDELDENYNVFSFTNTYKTVRTEPVKVGPQLNRDDHVAYIMGYPDGTVQPKGEITRAEACTIFFRLLTDSSRDYYFSKTNDYTDVNAGDWFNNAISTLSNAGIVTGYNDGTFRPNQPITRGEMAKIIANFANLSKGGKTFSDLSGHWSKSYVELAAGNGWIAGYPDGSFRPDQKITRAETVTMINRVLERVPAKELRLLSRSIMLTFPDNNPGDWYYIAIQEASNSHEYQRSVYETTGDEMWTKLIDNVDWTKLEK